MSGMQGIKKVGLLAGLNEVDPVAAQLIDKEMLRDADSINLNASENYPTKAVSEAADAPITDAEGYPGKRFHAGKEVLDEMERLCWRRALETFGLESSEWSVNVQVLSGSLANVFSYIALLEPGDVIMGLELSHGGHISHGYQTDSKKISETAIRFKSVPYHVDLETGIIDYDELERLTFEHKPRIITVGGSAYSRLIDYERVRLIANKSGSLVHCDMAHFCGLVAAAAIPSPFPHCDIVTTTTSKTFRGPDAAMIFCRKWMEDTINRTVFPRFQAGTDSAKIIALAVALLQARAPESISQQKQIIESARVLADRLSYHGYKLVGGGTDTHMVLMDLRPSLVGANRAEKILELVNLYCNRNSCPNDAPGKCSGIRLGTAPMVVRGMKAEAFTLVADIIHEAIGIAKKFSQIAKAQAEKDLLERPAALSSFLQFIGDGSEHECILGLRDKVQSLAALYPPPWKIG